MASLLRLLNNPMNMHDEVSYLTKQADEKRKIEYDAAVKIQSWIRGLQIRHYLRHLHNSSILIQKHWRGFMARSHFRIYVSNLHLMMRINFFHAMATRIQRTWRGFHARKYKHNFYARKRYFNALAVKNQIVRYELDEWQQEREEITLKKEMAKRNRLLMREARSKHHLRSTIQNPGVFNSPYRDQPSEMEKLLIQNKPKVGERAFKPKRPDPFEGCVDPTKPELFLQAPTQLPPLDDRKLQGPFKDRSTVRRQRYRPLEPTLLVDSSYDALRKAREELLRREDAKIVIDQEWAPATMAQRQYERTINSIPQWKQNDPSFRDENPTKWIAHKFKNTVAPIPQFRQFNNTYYQGQVKYSS